MMTKRSCKRSLIRSLLKLQEGRCFYCQQPISEADSSLDHLVPRSSRGPLSKDNLVVCCRPFNQFLGNVSPGVKFKMLADLDFMRAMARWCLVVDRNCDKRPPSAR